MWKDHKLKGGVNITRRRDGGLSSVNLVRRKVSPKAIQPPQSPPPPPPPPPSSDVYIILFIILYTVLCLAASKEHRDRVMDSRSFK